ncbi:MAG TPA: outer membrane beta-barrel protein [Gemmatimonadales bacterium]|nr:outer membrane beta-barrel protein [Gemmatimonadales bacterium]
MKLLRSALPAILALALGPAVGHAQASAFVHRGFWARLNVGVDAAGLSCDNCGAIATSGSLGLGGTLGSHVQLGVEGTEWDKMKDGVTQTTGNATVSGYFYPSPADQMYLKAGFGMAFSDATGGGSSVTRKGVGGCIGLGSDMPLSRKIAIATSLTWNFAAFGSTPGAGSLYQNSVQIGVGITFE